MRVKKYYKLVRVDYEDSAYFRIKNISSEAGIFSSKLVGGATAPNLEYSIDGVTWTTYDFTTLPEVTVAAGTNIYFRGDNPNGFSTSWNKYAMFHFTANYKLGGNIMSLQSKNNFESETTIAGYGFQMLFYDGVTPETNLVSVRDLSFGNVTAIKGLRFTFAGCTNLIDTPDFTNYTDLTLESTFRNTGITTGPDLSTITTSNGLTFAFGECVNLTNVTAPNISDLSNILTNWLNGAGTSVPAGTTKVVNVPTGATILTDSVSGIPTGWTRVDY